jgi:hypothetical protein
MRPSNWSKGSPTIGSFRGMPTGSRLGRQRLRIRLSGASSDPHRLLRDPRGDRADSSSRHRVLRESFGDLPSSKIQTPQSARRFASRPFPNCTRPALPISRASTNEPCSGNMGSIVFAVVPPRPLEPPATELVWASVVVVLIYVALWVVVVQLSLSLRRDGLTRWATTMLVVERSLLAPRRDRRLRVRQVGRPGTRTDCAERIARAELPISRA